MKQREISIVLGIFLIFCIISAGCLDNPSDDEKEVRINASHAIDIVAHNQTADEYFIENFEKEEWRLVRATLMNETQQEVNESTYYRGYDVWKVEMMERTCACGGIKELYVIEGIVSPLTGEIINITTGKVNESQYDKQICASTDCH